MPNQASAGNGAVGSRFYFGYNWRAVPEMQRSANDAMSLSVSSAALGVGMICVVLGLGFALRPGPVYATGRLRIECESTNAFWFSDVIEAGCGEGPTGADVSQYRSTSILVIHAARASEQLALTAVMDAVHRMEAVAAREKVTECRLLESPQIESALAFPPPVFLRPLPWLSISVVALCVSALWKRPHTAST